MTGNYVQVDKVKTLLNVRLEEQPLSPRASRSFPKEVEQAEAQLMKCTSSTQMVS